MESNSWTVILILYIIFILISKYYEIILIVIKVIAKKKTTETGIYCELQWQTDSGSPIPLTQSSS